MNAAYLQTNLVSDIAGLATITDPVLQNPWGISYSATSPFWVSNQGTSLTTLYAVTGANGTTVTKAIPAGTNGNIAIPITAIGPQGPTGEVNYGGAAFLVGNGGNGASAHFIFANLNGTISAWDAGQTAVIQVTNPGASYTGLAINQAQTLLYAANDVVNGGINVFNNAWTPIAPGTGGLVANAFATPAAISALGLAPFNVQDINGSVYVTYAPPGLAAQTHAAAGTGAVAVFTESGTLLQTMVGGALASPWGVALAPAGFGQFGGDLLVGNFSYIDSEINAFNPVTGAFVGTIPINAGSGNGPGGLWALDFGIGGSNGSPNTLYFADGINGQKDGLFGAITVVPEPAEMILRATSGPNAGVFEIYNISNSVVTSATSLGQVGLEWQVLGFGDFTGTPGESDMLLRLTSGPNAGNLEVYDISKNAVTSAAAMGNVGLEWTVAGFGDFSGNANETDMLMRNSNTGAFELYDISNNKVTSASALAIAYPMGTAASQWTVAGFGDFSGNAGESDMLLRATTGPDAGDFEVYDILNNKVTSTGFLAWEPLTFQVAGFGDFSGNANETDMLLRNSTTGAFELLDISNNANTSAVSMGQVGLEWTVAGFGDFSGNANETDMLMRNSTTGVFEVYDISNNAVTSATSPGQVGLEWQVGGFAAYAPTSPADPPAALTGQLVQAVASFGASGATSNAQGAILGAADASPQSLLAAPH